MEYCVTLFGIEDLKVRRQRHIFIIAALLINYNSFTVVRPQTTYYWGREKGEAELDFVVQWRNEIVPIEVKAGFRKKSKSLDVYRDLYHPGHVVRSALQNFGMKDNVYSVPLYMIADFSDLIKGID